MFKRKGLFWYDTHQRFFDWSTNFEGDLFGYQNPFIDKRIKYHLKKRAFLPDPKKNWQDWLKNQFNFWKNQFPILNDYHFHLLSDIALKNFLTSRVERVFAEGIETALEKDFLVFPDNPDSNTNHVLVTEGYCHFQDNRNFNAKELREKKKILLLNTTFPNLSGIEGLSHFDFIAVGGTHPFSLGGHKLLLSKDKTPEANLPLDRPMDINLWKIKLYLDGIKYYYKKSQSKNFSKRKKLFDQSLNSLSAIANLKILPAREGNVDEGRQLFFVKVIVDGNRNMDKMASENNQVFKHFNHRYFYKNLTILGQDHCFYIHLPINFDIDHFKNKTPQLIEFFKLWS